jgi:AraC-like DNA-binding protein
LSEVGDGFDVRSLALTFRNGAQLGRHSHAWGQLVFASSRASVTDAALDSGYQSAGVFTRQFGVTPGRYFSGS